MSLQPICFSIPWCGACQGHVESNMEKEMDQNLQSSIHFLAAKGIPAGKSQGSTVHVQFCIELGFGLDPTVLKTWEGWIIAKTFPAAAGILKHRKFKFKDGFKILSFSVSFIYDITYPIYIIYMIKQLFFAINSLPMHISFFKKLLKKLVFYVTTQGSLPLRQGSVSKQLHKNC